MPELHAGEDYDGPGDDAVHILSDDLVTTLCNTRARPGMSLVTRHAPLPDWFSGCWTCLDEARRRYG